MRLLVLLAIVLPTWGADGGQYADLRRWLASGVPIRGVLNYAACQLDGGPSRNATGGFELSAWSVERDGSVVIDTDKLIYDYQSKTGGYVFDFVRTTVFPNGTVTSLATDLPAPDPNTAPAKYSEIFTCSLNDGSVTFVPSAGAASVAALDTYAELLRSVTLGATVRAVVDSTSCTTVSGAPASFASTGFVLDIYEAFDEPASFGPPELAWGADELTYGLSGRWVRRQISARFGGTTNEMTLSFADLDPGTLATVESSPPKLTCSVTNGAARLFAVLPASAAPPEQLLRFRGFIVGHFTNAAQHALAGDDHPFAEHISDVVSHKVINAPPGFYDDDRFFALEESYYTTTINGTSSSIAKPMIFLFSPQLNGSVAITAYSPPSDVPVQALRNNNTALRLNFAKMVKSPDFNTATYTYDANTKSYHLDATTPIPNGIFRLTETIAAFQLTVLEDVVIDGRSVMPYHTPIVYDRV
jgi:hypothetical protein